MVVAAGTKERLASAREATTGLAIKASSPEAIQVCTAMSATPIAVGIPLHLIGSRLPVRSAPNHLRSSHRSYLLAEKFHNANAAREHSCVRISKIRISNVQPLHLGPEVVQLTLMNQPPSQLRGPDSVLDRFVQ